VLLNHEQRRGVDDYNSSGLLNGYNQGTAVLRDWQPYYAISWPFDARHRSSGTICPNSRDVLAPSLLGDPPQTPAAREVTVI
jgi:hypothetical protein